MKDDYKIRRLITAAGLFVLAVACLLTSASCKKLDFTRTEPIGQDKWLHYDDGVNYDGIFANSGGNFDIAIRFSASELAPYDGFRISKLKFFPKVGYPAVFYITIWSGTEPPTLLKVQEISSVIAETWNEVSYDESYYIDASSDMWFGVWITDYPASTYPAGCDNGPAVVGKGDLFSPDDGVTWYSLYTANSELNYNWNLQVYVTNLYAKTVPLAPSDESGLTKYKTSLRDLAPVEGVMNGVSSQKTDRP